MRTPVHLSDQHFGRIDEALIKPLTAHIERLKPDVVVVSGAPLYCQRAELENRINETQLDWFGTRAGFQRINSDQFRMLMLRLPTP